MAYLAAKSVFIIKLEATPGTAETPTATDFDLVLVDGELKPNIDFDSPNFNTGSHAKLADIPGMKTGTFSCKVPLRPGDTVATAPKYAKLFKACGAIGAVEGTDKGYSLTPLNTGDTIPCTVWEVMIDRGATPAGIKQKLAGAMGNLKFGADGIGKPIYAEFTLTGKWSGQEVIAAADVLTLNVCTDPDTDNPYTFTSATITGISGAISSFSLDAGNKVEPQLNPADSGTGQIDFFGITSRDPKFSANPLVTALATYNPMAIAEAATLATITIIVTTNSKPIKLTIPRVQQLSPELAVREGLKSWNLNYKCLQNGTAASLAVAGIAVEAAWELLQGAKS